MQGEFTTNDAGQHLVKLKGTDVGGGGLQAIEIDMVLSKDWKTGEAKWQLTGGEVHSGQVREAQG